MVEEIVLVILFPLTESIGVVTVDLKIDCAMRSVIDRKTT